MLNETKPVESTYVRIYDHGEFLMSLSFKTTSADTVASELLRFRGESE